MAELPQFGIYIHWPFCAAKCPYCDFNSHVAARIDHGAWKVAYLSEIDRVAEETGRRVVSSVFFGGGTPSLMDPETVDAVLGRIRACWPIANDLEVTLEANPTSVEAGRFRAFREGGVNRLSLGVQALNDNDLRRLGRMHSAAEARTALDIAGSVFDQVSFDLIYARQNQSLSDWEAELSEALSLAGNHLSLYQLTIEPGTVFGARFSQGKLTGLPDEDLEADMYAVTQEMTGAAGYTAYEVSNHARHGAEARHNLIYWTGSDYAGIGPGAHGRLTLGNRRIATETWLAPDRWMNAVSTIGTGDSQRKELSEADILAERLMMGLRLKEGISLDGLPLRGPREVLTKEIKSLQDLGMIENCNHRIRVTDAGRPVLNAILQALIP